MNTVLSYLIRSLLCDVVSTYIFLARDVLRGAVLPPHQHNPNQFSRANTTSTMRLE